jgi:hypothetical protein
LEKLSITLNAFSIITVKITEKNHQQNERKGMTFIEMHELRSQQNSH